ncbi:MAG: hypothetical protein Q8R30_01230 [bacterium]|nr:hypothetical protein [bacterium]MDZ4285869.1 hypothetical protein [Candidatus Sungbacteria bacterium]
MTWEDYLVSVDENQVPGFVKAARRIALQEGKTIQEVLDRSLEDIRSTGNMSFTDNVGKAIEAQLRGAYVRKR